MALISNFDEKENDAVWEPYIPQILLILHTIYLFYLVCLYIVRSPVFSKMMEVFNSSSQARKTSIKDFCRQALPLIKVPAICVLSGYLDKGEYNCKNR